MFIRICIFSFLCLLSSCNQNSERKPQEKLDPLLVELAGENYKDMLLTEIKRHPADTIQMITFQTNHYIFDYSPKKKLESHHFVYQNSGTQESYLTRSWSFCDCIKEKSKKEILKPGETAELNITFDPTLWKPGESKILTVYTRHFPHEFDFTIERRK